MVTEIIKINFEEFKEIYNKYIINRYRVSDKHISKVLYTINDAGVIISLEFVGGIAIGIFKTEDELYEHYGHNEQLQLI
ncbi:hypothetical protein [Macrococcus capreoli]|uniref:hypothetical protein n=1 Tax=Macrococcus capreoli TaxID=2982690 RepID=UPI0021D56E9B|nr:hypothetical protein [Macrococcus sp. TMW 2.2395]